MKLKELLNEHRGLAEQIRRDTGLSRAVFKNVFNPDKVTNFGTKKEIYEILLDYKLINPDEVSIVELFES